MLSSNWWVGLGRGSDRQIEVKTPVSGSEPLCAHSTGVRYHVLACMQHLKPTIGSGVTTGLAQSHQLSYDSALASNACDMALRYSVLIAQACMVNIVSELKQNAAVG